MPKLVRRPERQAAAAADRGRRNPSSTASAAPARIPFRPSPPTPPARSGPKSELSADQPLGQSSACDRKPRHFPGHHGQRRPSQSPNRPLISNRILVLRAQLQPWTTTLPTLHPMLSRALLRFVLSPLPSSTNFATRFSTRSAMQPAHGRQLLEAGEWTLEGNELVVKVAASATMIDMSFDADARRVAIATASGVLGRPSDSKFCPVERRTHAAPARAIRPVERTQPRRTRPDRAPHAGKIRRRNSYRHRPAGEG